MTILEGNELHRMIHGDCLEAMPTFPDASFDAVICDPPYPCIDREYGTWTVPEWEAMMHAAVLEFRRLLKPSGSAVIVLQPNSERIGKMRTWLWDFLSWCGKIWNMVQDFYWWNPATLPTTHCQARYGLARVSMKFCVWLGEPECFRDQDQVLWTQSDSMAARSRQDRALQRRPSGHGVNNGRMGASADRRSGTTPFNLLPISNTDSQSSAGSQGHGAGTPLELCKWWTRYVVPPGGLVLDPFCGTGTVGLAALALGKKFVGIEKMAEYAAISRQRLSGDMLVAMKETSEPMQRSLFDLSGEVP